MKGIVFCTAMLLSLLLMVSCGPGSAAGGADTASGTYRVFETGYQLKQIAVYEGKRWALTADNEVLAAENGKEDFRCVRKIEGIFSGTDGFVNACFVDAQTAYAAYFSEDGKRVVVERTSDGGESWKQTPLVYGDYGEVCDAGSVYLSFFDDENGYLLYCSTPGMGMMTKLLFRTEDAGESFSFVGDLTDELAGYPQGISFRDGENGYIGVSCHGEDSYLYRTENAGVEWISEKLPAQDKSISYIDGYAPVFYGKNGEGMIVLKTVGESASYRLYLTGDYGETWDEKEELPMESVQSYAADGQGGFLFVDGMGELYDRNCVDQEKILAVNTSLVMRK